MNLDLPGLLNSLLLDMQDYTDYVDDILGWAANRMMNLTLEGRRDDALSIGEEFAEWGKEEDFFVYSSKITS